MRRAFPGESSGYRLARDRLLKRELELRRAMETVAAASRGLPHGGVVPEDYVFQGAGADGLPRDVRLSELFMPGKDVLVIYSLMFPRDPGDTRRAPEVGKTDRLPLAEGPCPSCTALLDQLVIRRDGHTIRHFWGSELLYAPTEPSQDSRHVGTIEPLWDLLDLTPEGRGTDCGCHPQRLRNGSK